MNKKIFIGNLGFGIKDEDLEKMFSEFGDIEDCNVITDRQTNRSKGFGFVTFADEESAKNAVKEMHEKDIDGRKITVKEAEQKEDSRGRGRERSPEPQDEYSRYCNTAIM